MGAGPVKGIFDGGSNPEHFFLGSSHGAKKGVGLGLTSAPGVPRPNAKYHIGPIKRPLPSWWGNGLCIDPVTGESFEGRGKNCVPVPVWPLRVPLPVTQEEVNVAVQGQVDNETEKNVDVQGQVGNETKEKNVDVQGQAKNDSEELDLGSQEPMFSQYSQDVSPKKKNISSKKVDVNKRKPSERILKRKL